MSLCTCQANSKINATKCIVLHEAIDAILVFMLHHAIALTPQPSYDVQPSEIKGRPLIKMGVMSISELPLEIFQALLEEVVRTEHIYRCLELRLVNSGCDYSD